MNVLTTSLGELVDRTLLQVQAAPEQGSSVTLGNALTTTETSFTLSSEIRSLNVTDLVEVGTESFDVLGPHRRG